MANKQLTASVRLNTSQAEQKLRNIAKAIDTINRVANRQSNAYAGVNSALSKSNKQTSAVVNQTKQWASAQRQVGTSLKSNNSLLTNIGSKLKSIAATYIGIMGAKAVTKTSDTITSAQNRLNALEGATPESTQLAMDKMYVASQNSRSGFDKMLSNVSKTMTLAGDSFDNNIDNAIRFQEIMAKAYAVGGASDEEATSSMYQLVQALGSGILQGDELRSVREGAPLAYKEIEKFAQKVFETEDSLKDLASQGVITSDLVVAAIMDAGEGIDKQFAKTKMTFSQAAVTIKNMAVKAFTPVMEMFNRILNSDVGQAIINGIGYAFVFIANVVLWVADIIGNVFNWFVQNWPWIQYVVIFALLAIGMYLMWLAGVSLVRTAIAIAGWIAEHATILGVIGIIALLVTFIIWLANTTSSGAGFMVAAIATVGVAVFALGMLFNSTTMMIVGIVIVVVALIVSLLATCGEEIMAGVYAVGAFIYNLVVGTVNGILQFIWSYFVEPFLGIIEWILNCCNGGFNSFGDAVANLIGQVISWFLSLGKVVTKIIDAIFGTDWTSGLSSLQDKVLAWGKNENSITLSREAPTVQSIAGNFGVDLPDRIEYGSAMDAGAKKGAQIENTLESWGNKLKNSMSFDGLGKSLGKFAGIERGDNLLNGIGDPSGSYLPGLTDPKYDLDFSKPEDLLANIDKNTGDMKDSMDLSNDDMEYLRKIAEMEWRNEFTTAEIKVDMTNHNTVNGEKDLDGIVDYLSDVLRAEMTNVAYGVHY